MMPSPIIESLPQNGTELDQCMSKVALVFVQLIPLANLYSEEASAKAANREVRVLA